MVIILFSEYTMYSINHLCEILLGKYFRMPTSGNGYNHNEHYKLTIITKLQG